MVKKSEDYRILPLFPQQPVSDPHLSPDEKKVLFTYNTVNIEENKYDSHLWLLSLNSEKPIQFTNCVGNDSNPRWSPDGKQILFLSDRINHNKNKKDEKRKKQIWIISSKGGEAKCLTSIKEGVQQASWSPDGKQILFLSDVKKNENRKDSDVKVIDSVKYKSDIRGFFVGKITQLFVTSSVSGEVRQLTFGESDVASPVWSPNSSKIAFISNYEDYSDLMDKKNIYSISTSGGALELLLKSKGPINVIKWSPNGEYLGFVGFKIEETPVMYKKMDLWLLSLKDKKLSNLTLGFDRTLRLVRDSKLLQWTMDSENIYFIAWDHGKNNIFKVNLDGKVENVANEKINVFNYVPSKDDSFIIFTATNHLTPSELWIKKETKIRKLTSMNKPIIKQLNFSMPKEFTFTASDGVDIQGWIIKPHQFNENTKYPTIIEVHGGPWSAYGSSLMAAEHEFQVLADHGYVVVYTNPRGSIGFGEAFTSRISGEWGGRDFQDIMEAVDYVIKTYPFIDSKRLGVAGGSYGGFMTNWIVGHTDRFKAAVSMRSISNWYSFMGTSHVGWLHVFIDDISWGKDPWDNLQVIMDRSPITYIKNVKTPLLLIHSEGDYSCPMEQAEQMFTALKKLKREVQLIRFPNECHELSRSGQPKHRVERLQHIIKWFDKYLKK